VRTENILRLNRLIKSPRAKFAGALALDCLGMRHLIVRFDPVMACNIRCGMCYFSDEAWLATNPVTRFSDEEIDRLAEMFLPYALQFHIGCGAEPTMYKNFLRLVEIGKKYKVPFVAFTTNAQLLTADKSEALIAAGLDEITISAHGVLRESYEQLMKRASFDRFHQNLAALAKAKRAAHSGSPRIRVNYTVNPDNLRELRQFFDVFGDYDISTLQIRPIVDLGETTEYRNKNLAPFIAEYDQIMDELGLECRKRGIALLANREDPTYQSDNASGFVYEKAVLRYVGPNEVWRDDFDWRTSTYREFQKRVGYRRELLGYVFHMPSFRSATHAAYQVMS
jgi:molybdenum cofactor biosynthesis enzyme MoaA